jgi:dTDP-4-dehydrorhamnose 3,5-epimerase-like enzyme
MPVFHRVKMPEAYTINDCKIIELNKFSDARGNLTFIEGGRHIPFDILRVYYIYDVPAGLGRAGHAHNKLFQLMIPLAGSFDITLHDGLEKRTVTLGRPYEGLLVTPMIWRIIDNFSPGAICLALASDLYEEASYYRNYNDFLAAANQAREQPLVSNSPNLGSYPSDDTVYSA